MGRVTLELEARCPAATVVRGASTIGFGVICGVMARDAERADSILEGLAPGVFVSAREDPSTLVAFCCGEDLPPLSPDVSPPAASYVCCPLWAAEKELEAALDRLGGLEDPLWDVRDGIEEAEQAPAEEVVLREEPITREEAEWLTGKA